MTIAVVDDYEPDRLEIVGCATRFFQESEGRSPQCRHFSSGEEFIAGLVPHLYDLVLLDCCMEGMDGMETARQLRRKDHDAVLIFVTTCGDYAVGGYLVSAWGYLMKPYTYKTFYGVLENALTRLPHKRQIIAFSDGNETRKIPVDDIVYCDVDGHYVQIHLKDCGVIRMRTTFSSLASLLGDYPQFLECFRGCIINMAHTYKAEELNFLMDTGERVPFRKKEHRRLLNTYSNYLFGEIRSKEL